MKSYEVGKKLSTIPNIRSAGRPKKWETVEELEEQIQKYFRSCFLKVKRHQIIQEKDPEDPDSEVQYDWVDVKDDDGEFLYEQIRPFTVTGLAVALDTTRETLLDYENKPENAQFSDTIKRAKQVIHNYADEYLYEGKNQTGAIFSLKNNWGWVDRTETDLTTKGEKINNAAVAAKVDDILKQDTPK